MFEKYYTWNHYKYAQTRALRKRVKYVRFIRTFFSYDYNIRGHKTCKSSYC